MSDKKWTVVAFVGLSLLPRVAAGQTTTSQTPAPQAQAAQATAQAGKPVGRTYEEIFQQYLAQARNTPLTQNMWMADLASDAKARRLNDLVTIRVVESVSAKGAADSTVNKNGSGNVKIPLPKNIWDNSLGMIVPFSSETKFDGSGGTTRTTELSANMTARVIEVLPNGDLVVQGVREININGDRNLVVLSGVIRSIDIGPGNVISSTRIGQLQISALSQGLIKDSLTPGYLIRLLNKVF